MNAFEGIEETALGLHDAFLDLSSMSLLNGTLILTGHTIQPYRRLRLAKYKVVLRVTGVAHVDVHDQAFVDQIDVDIIAEESGRLTIRGKMPVEIVMSVANPTVTGLVEPRPHALRTLLGWRPYNAL